MRRFASVVPAILFISLFLGALIGCGGSSTPFNGLPTPGTVTLSAPSTSVDLGTTVQFTAVPSRPAVATAAAYSSSNPSVLSFVPAAGGLACAGKWDSTGQVCSPHSVGVAQVTATVNGVTSPPVTVWVHEHVDTISLSLLPVLTPIPPGNCVTLGTAPGILNYLDFQAQAFSHGMDVTNTVGSFTFQLTNSSVARVSTTDSELANNNGNQVTQARVTAAVPGITQIYATVSGVSSLPVVIGGNPYFETCRVQSINLQVGNAETNTTFASSGTTSVTVTPTVVDRLGYTLTNPPLTWTSLSPVIGQAGNTGDVTTSKTPGAVGIVASCKPPSCNVNTPGVTPINPVYSSTLSSTGSGQFEGTPIIGTVSGPAVNSNAYATTTECDTAAGTPVTGCQPLLYPISTSNNVVSSSVVLPSSPNSFVFTPTGTKAFLGSRGGLMVFTPGNSTVPQSTNIPGKVLAISLDGNTVIVSDTVSVPNQVYIVGVGGSATTLVTSFFIPGATTAAFSPEGLKAFIVGKASASDPNLGDTLYVYSPLLPLVTKKLAGTANAVAPYANGALGYLSGGSASPAINLFNTCDTTYGIAASIPVPRLPTMFQVLPDGVHAIGFDPPGVDVFAIKTLAPTPATLTQPNSTTCPFSVAAPDPPDQEFSFANLGQGNFTPLKLIISSDNSRAYILASNLSSIFIYDFGVGTVSAVPLTGSPVPLDASLTSDGTLLYVGTSDGSVHVVSTVSGGDLQQITFTNNNATNKGSLCNNIPQFCNPDVVAVQPK
ncbi:MAG TPA: WD40 repeat domain-containing protein [Terriglobales bacterium]|nr:WD40 repeat domain-containing protein [Terriglobales bacterium]